MRGSIQYKDMFEMTMVERETIDDFVQKRLESQRERMYPVY
jgi:hypothetical protein